MVEARHSQFKTWVWILSSDLFSQCVVLCGYSGFQAAAALPQFALVAVQSHLLQGWGGRRCSWYLSLGGCSRPYATRRDRATSVTALLQVLSDKCCETASVEHMWLKQSRWIPEMSKRSPTFKKAAGKKQKAVATSVMNKDGQHAAASCDCTRIKFKYLGYKCCHLAFIWSKSMCSHDLEEEPCDQVHALICSQHFSGSVLGWEGVVWKGNYCLATIWFSF